MPSGDFPSSKCHSIVKQLRNARCDADITARDMAAAIGVGYTTLLHYEAGRRQPRLREIEAYAAKMNMQITLTPRPQ